MAEAQGRSRDSALEARWSAIARKLDAASGVLARQGSVASRRTAGGTRVFSVRYVELEAGTRKQRSIYLGAEPELARRAAELIRERRQWAREAEGAARLAAASCSLARRLRAGPRSTAGGPPGRPGGLR